MSSPSHSTAKDASGRAISLCAAFKLLRFGGALFGWHGLWRLGRPFAWNVPAWRERILRGWAHDTAQIIGMRIQIKGPVPKPPFLLVSNHLSYLDIPLIASVAPGAFVAKKQVANWPVLGRMTRDLGAIFVDREHRSDVARVAALIEAELRAGHGITLFPEGSSSPGARVESFHPALLEPAARLGIPVHYAALTYRTRAGELPAHIGACWWGDMEFTEHLRELLKMPGFEATLHFGDTPIQDGNRKTLARALHAGVTHLFDPLVDHDTLARDRTRLEHLWKTRAQTNSQQRTSMS